METCGQAGSVKDGSHRFFGRALPDHKKVRTGTDRDEIRGCLCQELQILLRRQPSQMPDHEGIVGDTHRATKAGPVSIRKAIQVDPGRYHGDRSGDASLL
jgi:hypothetical protein